MTKKRNLYVYDTNIRFKIHNKGYGLSYMQSKGSYIPERGKDIGILIIIILIISILTSLFVLYRLTLKSSDDYINLYEQEGSIIEIPIEEIGKLAEPELTVIGFTYPEIEREIGYNSILLDFRDMDTNSLYIQDDIYAIYSKTKVYYGLIEAIDAGVIKDWRTDNSRYSFLLQDGFVINFKFDPYITNKLVYWDSYKSNYPVEIRATSNGSSRLTVFNVTVDYASPIVQSHVEVLDYN